MLAAELLLLVVQPLRLVAEAMRFEREGNLHVIVEQLFAHAAFVLQWILHFYTF